MDFNDPHVYFRERIQRGGTAEEHRRFLELLWAAYGQEVFLYAHAKLRNLEDARDVCQDTFVKVMQWLQGHIEQVPATVNFPAWLRRIARNTICDRFRRPAVIGSWSHMEDGQHAACPDDQDRPEKNTCHPLDTLSHQEELDALHHCIDLLPETSRRIIVMRDLEGDSYDHIAQRAGMPRNTVGVVLYRARKQLRDCVELRFALCSE